MASADHAALMKRALHEIQSLRAELAEAKRASQEPIAIVGIGCRFPGGANTPDAYWRMLQNATDAIVEVPPSRWDVEAFYDANPDAAGKMYTRFGGFLGDVDGFDAQFFGVSPLDAMNMDPQQRLLLEVAWEAFENAGHVPGAVPRTGVYVGSFMDDYLQLDFAAATPKQIDAYNTLGLLRALAAGRLSYVLDLHGPAMQLDTACSSSLLAAHLAVQALRNRDCDLALAGGVNLILVPEVTIGLCRMKAMAADGRCKTFDARADGYVRGEGCGIVVLERLSDALTRGDRIIAVIRGSAVNHDGRSNGLTAPNGTAQKTVIREALANAGVEASEVDFVEVHGTGTALGDPIEAIALGETLCRGRSATQPLLAGSVKSNFGHLESAAGAAALIKVALSLERGAIPASLHFEEPNPHIPWDQLPLRVVTETRAWPREERRIAGISSFGMSGTNVHMIVERAPAAPVSATAGAPPYLLPLSAPNDDALDALAQGSATFLDSTASAAGDICFTAARGRRHFDCRRAVAGDSPAALAAALREPRRRRGASRRPRVAFLFPGQGSQIDGHLEALLREPVFRDAFEACDAIARPLIGRAIAGTTQLAIFAFQIALAKLWQSWGIVPDAVVGHSVGEYAAATVAGVFALDDAIHLLAERERLIDSVPQHGAMVALLCAEEEAAAIVRHFGDGLSIAALNGTHVVVSGDEAIVRAAVERARGEGIGTRLLRVANAFHSNLMEPVLAPFEAAAARVPRRKPSIAFVSALTGDLASEELVDAVYWRRHVREPVRFAAAVGRLSELGYRAFLEIGPHATLSAMARPIVGDALVLPSLRDERAPRLQLFESLAALYEEGAAIDWAAVAPSGTKVALPTYPFQRQRYWVPERPRTHERGEPAGPRRLDLPFSNQTRFEWPLDAGWLRDHAAGATIVLPAAAYLAMAVDAGIVLMSDIRFPRPLAFREGHAPALHLVLDEATFRFAARDAGNAWQVHCSGATGSIAAAPDHVDLAALQRVMRPAEMTESSAGFTLGPSFRWTRDVRIGEREVLCRLEPPPGVASDFKLHPGLVDSALRALALCLPPDAAPRDGEVFAPVKIDALAFSKEASGPLWCHARATDVSPQRIRGDIHLIAADGTVLLDVRGLEAAKLSIASLTGTTSLDDALLETVWHRATSLPTSSEPAEQKPSSVYHLPSTVSPKPSTVYCLTSTVSSDARAISVDPRDADRIAELVRDLRPARILFLCEPDVSQEETVRALLATLHALDASGLGAHLCVVTRQAQAVLPHDPVDPTHAWAWGLGRVVALEQPRLRWTSLDIDRDLDDALPMLLANAFGEEAQLAFRAGEVYLPRLEKATLAASDTKPLFRDDAAYVVTGAFGALGTSVALWMADEGARHFVLAGRNAPLDHAVMTGLARRGARAVAMSVDVSDRDSVARMFAAARSTLPPIRGIVHAAGILDDALLADQTWERFERVFATKVRGTANLHEESRGLDLDHFVCFSSAAALIGSRGQANYAAANSFMDALMHHRRTVGLAGLTINWGAWAESGMAARMDAAQSGEMEWIDPAAALALLGRIMRSGKTQLGVVPMQRAKRDFDATGESIATLLDRTPDGERRERLARHIRERIIAVVGHDPFPPDEPEPSFFELGMDSLMSLDLRNRLQTDLDRALPSTVAFEYPTVEELADYLLSSR